MNHFSANARIVFVAAVVLFVGQATFAQSASTTPKRANSPSAHQHASSYDVTVGWIKSKFSDFGGEVPFYGNTTTHIFGFQSMDNCTLKFTDFQQFFEGTTYRMSSSWSYRIPLADVSVSIIESSPTSTGIHFYSSKRLIFLSISDPDKNGLETSHPDSADIFINHDYQDNNAMAANKALAARVLKAFGDAITYCKASPKSESNEPY